MAAGDAHEYFLFACKNRIVFPIFDGDGDLVTGATGLDSEISKDQGTFTDCTNEAVEIATASGMYYLELTSAESTAKQISLIIKTSTVGAKTTPRVLQVKRFAQTMRTGTAQAGGATSITLDASASAQNDIYNGLYVRISNDSPAGLLGEARRIVAYDGGTKVATVDNAWSNNPTSSSTFEVLAGDPANVNSIRGIEPMIGTDLQLHVNVRKLESDAQSLIDLKDFADAGYDPAVNKVEGVKLTDTLTTYTGNTPQTGDAFARLGAPIGASISADIVSVQADTDNIQTRLPAALVSGRMDSNVQAMANNVITAAAAAPDLATELQAGLATAANLATVAGYIDTEITDIQNRLPAALVGGRMDASVGAMAANTMTAAAAAADLTTELQAGIATSASLAIAQADITSLSLRLGEFTGTGLNTVLGFFRAIMRKTAALTPSDVAGSFDNTTDSLEAIKDNQLDAAISTRATPAQVNVEVLDVLTVDTFAEPAAVPAATASLKDKLGWIQMVTRNKIVNNASTKKIRNDADSADIGSATVSAAAGTLTKGKYT